MRKLVIVIIFFSINVLASQSSTQIEQVTKVSWDQNKSTDKKFTELKPTLSVKTGFSDNPVQFPDKDLSSGYLNLAPELAFNKEVVKNKLFFLSNLKGDFKKYEAKDVDEIKSQSNIQLDIGLSTYISANHEFGTTISGVYNKGSSLDFTSSGISEMGRDVKYSQGFYELYYSFNQPRFNVELSGSYVVKAHDSLVQDDVVNSSGQFNEFKDDFKQVATKLKVNYKLSADSKVFIEPNYSRRAYKERSARHTEGTTNQGVNPLLVELHRGVSVGYKFDDEFLLAELKSIYTKEEDLIYKAHNADSYGFEAKIKLPIGQIANFKAEYSWAQKDYTYFVTNPQEDPTSRNLRKDVDQTVKIGLSKQISKVLIDLNYEGITKTSNYKPFGSTIGSIYDEKIVSLGMAMSL